MNTKATMEKIVSLCKRRGFVFPGSEIYGGLANTWDFGPYGVELLKNIKEAWWKYFVRDREDMVGIDAGIFMNPKVWEASGHVQSFSDPLMDCKKCKARVRGDKLIEEWASGVSKNRGSKSPAFDSVASEGWDSNSGAGKGKFPKNWAGEKTSPEDLLEFIMEEKIVCPHCGELQWTKPRLFNLMFKTHQGVIEDAQSLVYLRPETAQGIFVNFKNILNSSRKKLPFGIGQIGKAFRNEITPGNFIFRTREFEQMEIEYFVREGNWKDIYDNWREVMERFYVEILGLKKENMRWRQHSSEELSHYSKETWDLEYEFPFGWGELWGIAYRTDFDLKQHALFSGESLDYLDPETNERFTPHCIEPTFGATRTLLVALLDSFDEDVAPSEKEGVEAEVRTVLRLHPILAPVKVAVLPLVKKLNGKGREIFGELKKHFVCELDESGSIGKRYRRQDEIGTPFCVTIDFTTLEDDTVTIRDRDSMKQERIKSVELPSYFHHLFGF